MGAIREQATGQIRQLEPEHLIGRAPVCGLRINQKFVSAQHAILRWTGERWDLKDLGSRNGTFLNGTRIKAGEDHAVPPGSIIAFGKSEQQWELVDESAPDVMAFPLDGADPVLMEGELLALPSSEDPRITIYRGADGWVLERPDESITPIAHSQTVEVDGRTWKFCCPDNISKTSLVALSPELEVRHLLLSFSVSRDEEHVQLQAAWGTNTYDLGARAHNYLLLILARRRLEDAAEGLPETACGWVYQEDLEHDPSMAAAQLNIDVFRLRKQFAALGAVDAANIIERRPRTRQLRVGTGRISVVIL
jgi:hypothetical protein